MAELSQLGATGESLVEESLGEEVSFTYGDKWFNSHKRDLRKELKGQEIL